MMLFSCSAPHRSAETASCSDPAPRERLPTLRERVMADPAITLRMLPEEAICAAPIGSLVAVTYTKRGGVGSDLYVGRVVAASGCGGASSGHVIFKLLCLNRGEPGAPEHRTFSTQPVRGRRAGVLHGVRLLELPAPRSGATA
jgi:hypothetical protein